MQFSEAAALLLLLLLRDARLNSSHRCKTIMPHAHGQRLKIPVC